MPILEGVGYDFLGAAERPCDIFQKDGGITFSWVSILSSGKQEAVGGGWRKAYKFPLLPLSNGHPWPQLRHKPGWGSPIAEYVVVPRYQLCVVAFYTVVTTMVTEHIAVLL